MTGPNLAEYREPSFNGTLSPVVLAALFRRVHPKIWWSSSLIAFACLQGPQLAAVMVLGGPLGILLGPVFLMAAIADSLYADVRDDTGFLGRSSELAMKSLLLLPIIGLFLGIVVIPVLQGLLDALLFFKVVPETAFEAVFSLVPLIGVACYAVWLRSLHSLVVTGHGVFRAGQDGLRRPLVSQGGTWIPLGSSSGLPLTALMLCAGVLADRWLVTRLSTRFPGPLSVATSLLVKAAIAVGLAQLVCLLVFAWMIAPGQHRTDGDRSFGLKQSSRHLIN